MEKSGFIEKNGGYYYIRPDNTAVLAWSSFKNNAPDHNAEPINKPFVVESEINGCPVTAIDELAFFNSLLTEIVLPDSIQFIGDGAFRECRFLENINFPENLKYINRDAFSRCLSLKNVSVKNGQSNIFRTAPAIRQGHFSYF